MGIGVALFFMPTLSILLSDLPPQQIARLGAGHLPADPGGSFAASLTTWIWIRRADQHHAYLSENISQFDPTTRHTSTAGRANPQSYAQLEQILNGQAYMMSTVDYFTLMTWVFAGLILLVWFCRVHRQGGAGIGGH